MKTSGSKTEDIHDLTPREIEIIKLICTEKSTIEIARKLNLSTHTVDAHRHNIMLKLRVNSVVGMVKFAVKERLYRC